MNNIPHRREISVFHKVAYSWYMYIMPIIAFFVAFIHFRSYGIYLFLKYIATIQCCFYAVRLFSSNNIVKKSFAFVFIGLVIIFCPFFGIHMSRASWIILDLVLAIASIITNIFFYKATDSNW